MGVLPVVATDEAESLQEQCLGIIDDHRQIPQPVSSRVDRLGLADRVGFVSFCSDEATDDCPSCAPSLHRPGLQSALTEAAPAPEIPRAIPIDPEEKILKPGEFLWHPERSPEGPLLVVCTIDDQMLYAYRNGVEIARSTVSTGRKGKKTPTGVFTILQRKVDHESSIYKGAKMPYMQRLTWTGIAMHAGKLPGYPASAGCIRLPLEFSKLIFGEMQNGSTVVITQKKSTPSKSDTPASILLDTKVRNLTNRPIPKGEVVWEPEKSPHGPVSILLSYADTTVYVWRNGVQIGQSPVGFNTPTEELPDGVFLMLAGVGFGGSWTNLSSLSTRSPSSV